MAHKEPDLDDPDTSTPSKVDKNQHPEDKTSTKSWPRGKHDKRELRPLPDGDDDDYESEKTWQGPEYPYPPSWSRFEKMSKEEAGYQQGVPFETCGGCNFYQGGHCKIVRGHISAAMKCWYFQKKYSAMTFSAVPLRVRLKR